MYRILYLLKVHYITYTFIFSGHQEFIIFSFSVFPLFGVSYILMMYVVHPAIGRKKFKITILFLFRRIQSTVLKDWAKKRILRKRKRTGIGF